MITDHTEWLKEHGATGIRAGTIEPDSELVYDERFQIRERTDDALVAEYAAKMRRGEKFPPVLIRETSRGLVVVDGKHRIKGGDKANETLDAYFFACNDADQRTIAFLSNDSNGLRHNETERTWAVLDHRALGLTTDEIALRLGLGKSTVAHIIQNEDMRDSLAAMGAAAAARKLNHAQLRRICQEPFPEVRKVLAEEAAKRDLASTDIKEMIAAGSTETREADRIKAVQIAASRLGDSKAANGNKSTKRNRKRRHVEHFNMHSAAILSRVDGPTLVQEMREMSDDNVREFQRRLELLSAHVQDLETLVVAHA